MHAIRLSPGTDFKGYKRSAFTPRARKRGRDQSDPLWLKELGAQPGVAGVQGDAPAPSADLG